MKFAKGFTLIELLIVVLIIGILAAIALPQYNKAVWRSRVSELKIMIKSLHDAEEIYSLAHGEYTSDLSKLEINFDSLPLKPTSSTNGFAVRSKDAVRANERFELGVSANSDGGIYLEAMFIKGKYKYGGFLIALNGTQGSKNNILMCQETPSMSPAGKFCQEIIGGQYFITFYSGWRLYTLP
jgi:prepilin-type N-terminal cleavage/methylation domain-containing protein